MGVSISNINQEEKDNHDAAKQFKQFTKKLFPEMVLNQSINKSLGDQVKAKINKK